MPVPIVSSLDILCPSSNKQIHAQTRKAPTSKYLEDLSVDIINLLNIKDYRSPPIDRLSTTVISELDGSVVGRTREEHIQVMEKLVKTFPNLHVEITGTSSFLLGRGYATVWVLFRVTNYPFVRLWKESVKVFAWERRDGEWECVKHIGMGGSVFVYDEVFTSPGTTPSSSPANDSLLDIKF